MLPGYRLDERLHHGTSAVWRGVRVQDHQPIVVKLLGAEYPTRQQLSRFRFQFDIVRDLGAARHVVMPVGLEAAGHGLALVMPDFGGAALDRQLPLRSVREALDVAIATARGLQEVHRAGIVHRDVKPANIVRNPRTGEVRLIDFDSATRVGEEAEQRLETLVGTLRYLAPEQTGRMRRSVDTRADFYALGATLYELLVGRPVFDGDDPLELIHAHLAVRPRPCHEIDPRVPRELSDIVDCCLAKDPEDRYQSAEGLLADLLEVRERLGRRDAGPFRLRAHDRRLVFRVPERLYGRDAELAALRTAWDRASESGRGIVVIGGAAGAGKSSLVRELAATVGGRFAQGKFDQMRRDTPFSGIVQAFRQLIASELGGSEAQVAALRAELQSALGDDGAAVLAELLPEIAAALGPRPRPPELPPAQALLRSQLAFRGLVAAFAAPGRPLALFLDDLQWADLASIELLEFLAGAGEHLALLVAQRDDEVGAEHPWARALGRLEQQGVPVDRVPVGPLAREAVEALVRDALGDDRGAEELGRRLHARSGGNPFFVGQLLLALHRAGAIVPDGAAFRWTGADAGIGDDVARLLVSRLEGLPEATRALLPWAACMGGVVDLRSLASLAGTRPREAGIRMWPAVADGLLAPIGDAYKEVLADDDGEGDGAAVRFRFAHDRVQQAAWELVEPDRRAEVHVAVGRLLLERVEAEPDLAFAVVEHLAHGLDRLAPQEREPAARAHLVAARRAMASGAFQAARPVLTAAMSLLPPDRWTTGLAAPLVKLRADCESLVGDGEAAERLYDELLAHTPDAVARAAVHRALVWHHTNRGATRSAASSARAGLAGLGVGLPIAPGMAGVLAEVLRVRWRLWGRGPEVTRELPPLGDPALGAAMELFDAVLPPAYELDPNLFAWVSLRMVRLSLEHGHAPASPCAYTAYGIILATALGDWAGGLRWCEAGGEMASEAGVPAVRMVADYGMGAMMRHWQRPAAESLEYLDRSIDAALAAGSSTYVRVGWATRVMLLLHLGRGLDEVAEAIADHRTWPVVRTYPAIRVYLAGFRGFVANLQGRTVAPDSFDHDDQIEADVLASVGDHAASIDLGWYSGYKALACYVRGEWDAAWRESARMLTVVHFFEQYVNTVPFRAIAALSAIQLLRRGSPPPEARRVAKRCAAAVDKMAGIQPENFAAWRDLIAAEQAVSDGDPARADRAFDAAIQGARAGRLLHLEALASESAGRAWLGRGQPRVARAFLEDAHAAYVAWGAHDKARRLLEEHADLLRFEAPRERTHQGTLRGVGNLDVGSAMKAATAIAGETTLDRVLSRILRGVIENAGAGRGVLVVDEDGRWLVQGVGEAGGDEAVLQGLPLESCDALPRTIAGRVARTGEQVVLVDASRDERFARDPYVAARQTRSVLCAPVTHAGRRVALVYLENDLVAGAFTDERVRLVQVLCGQAAVSILNARLVRDLQQALDAQTRLARAQERFVPREFLESLRRTSIVDVERGDHVHREMSVVYSDIRGFTTLFEAMTPAEHIRFINRYLAHMEPAVMGAGGFVDSYIGDAVLALFEGEPDGTLDAAVRMCRGLSAFNAERAQEGLEPVGIGIGVNTGVLTLGTIGGSERLKCGVIGDAVNLTARVESLTRTYGSICLASHHTVDRLVAPERWTLRLIDRVTVKGKTEAVRLYELLDVEPDGTREGKLETLDRWGEARSLYEDGRFGEAERAFADVLARCPTDGAAAVHLDRCGRYERDGPPPGWDGVEKLDHK